MGKGARVRVELKPPLRVKLAYGLGQAPQSAGFDTAIGFVFFYYTAVLGLSGALVGAALAISLVFDAVVDPLVGSLSDNTRSRLGRRLPLMILAIAPMAASLGLLFSPPRGLSGVGLFVWLTATSVAIRSAISLFNVPYIALGAEMADGYVERSSVVAWRTVIGLASGVGVTAMGFVVFFGGPKGLMQASAYAGFGWAAAGIVTLASIGCCLGVARYAARLPAAPRDAAPLLARLPGEVAEVFRNRSFRVLFVSAVLFYIAVGLNGTLNSHTQVFVWKLAPRTIQFIGYAYVAGILVGIPIAPLLQRVMEKKSVVAAGIVMVLASWVILPCLRATGLLAPVGEAALAPLALSVAIAGVGVGFVAIAYPSMMADAADEHELLFGRRREGLYFAGLGFAAKMASGVGVLAAGAALDLIGFHTPAAAAARVAPSARVLVELILAWGPAAAILAVAALILFLPYAITRRRHDEISAQLRSA